jgi:amino acid transporter
MATLQRVASRWQIVALAVNDVVGSGVYLLPAAAAALLGPASLWAVAVAGVAVLAIVLCFAEASSHFDEPGSAYLYARHAFGSLVGFEVGWMAWLARVASVASLSVGFAQALSFVFPATAQGWGRSLAITAPLLALTAINIVGVRSGVNAAVVLVVGKLLPLGVFIAAGCFAVSWPLLAGQRPTAEGGLGAAVLLLLFAYGGFENTPAAAGEYRDPRRDVPFALLVQIGIVTLIYVAVQWVALSTVPDLGASVTPLADGARIFLGTWGGWLLTAGAAISILGTNGGSVLAGPRYLYALAREGFDALSTPCPRLTRRRALTNRDPCWRSAASWGSRRRWWRVPISPPPRGASPPTTHAATGLPPSGLIIPRSSWSALPGERLLTNFSPPRRCGTVRGRLPASTRGRLMPPARRAAARSRHEHRP